MSSEVKASHSALHSEAGTATILKRTRLGDRTIELLFHPVEGLVGKIISSQAITTVYNHSIKGVPQTCAKNLSALQSYFKQSYLILHPTVENQVPSYVIHTHLTLLGGGGSLSKASDSFKDANKQVAGNFYAQAILALKKAIADIKSAIDEGYTGEKKIKLNEMLRDAHFQLAEMYEATKQYKEALENFQAASNLGKREQAEPKMVAIYLMLAKTAKENGDTTDQLKNLSEAKKLGSIEAADAISVIQQANLAIAAAEMKTENPEMLAKHTTKTMWVTGFRLGKGVSLTGRATSIVIQNMVCSKIAMPSIDQYMEYLIWGEEDLQRMSHVGAGLSTNQSFWHVKMIADYAKRLAINKQKLHCIIANTYVAPYAHMFGEGTLTENSLCLLENAGYRHFTDIYGSHLVGGYTSGALFLGCISFSVNSHEDALSLCASLKGSLTGLLNMDAGANKAFIQISRNRSMEVNVETIGIQEPIHGRVENLEALRQKHESFRKAISSDGSLSPVEAICEPWSSLEEVKKCLNIAHLEASSPIGMIKRYKQKVLGNADLISLSKLYTPLRCVGSTIDLLREDKSVDLFAQFDAFLNGDKKVFVLLGEAGSGKSAFLQYVEREFWGKLREEEALNGELFIPIRVEIIKLKDPVTQIVTEHLSRQGLTGNQIQTIKEKGKILLLLDGYDEGNYKDTPNLFQTNSLGEWNGKVLISGRLNASKALNPNLADHLHRFSPIINDRIRKDLVDEAIICPFFPSQIGTYLDKFIQNSDPDLRSAYPTWFENNGERFKTSLPKVPGLLELIKTPFVLQSVIESLPKIITHSQTSKFKLLKYDIYKIYTQSCFEREEAKMHKRFDNFKRPLSLEHIPLSQVATTFCRQIAIKMHEEGVHSVVYIPKIDSLEEDEKEVDKGWDFYFGEAQESTFLRIISSDILRKSYTFEQDQYREQYTFTHPELMEYFLTLSPTPSPTIAEEKIEQ